MLKTEKQLRVERYWPVGGWGVEAPQNQKASGAGTTSYVRKSGCRWAENRNIEKPALQILSVA